MDRDNSDDSYNVKDRIKSRDGAKVYRAILPTVGIDFKDDVKGIAFKNNELFRVHTSSSFILLWNYQFYLNN